MNRISDRLSLFSELISCIFNFYLWEYDKEMNLLSSNCPNENSLDIIFSLQDEKEYIKNYIQTNHLPIIFSNNLGLTWIAVFEQADDKIEYIHLLGPVFTDEVSMKEKEHALTKYALSAASKQAFRSLLKLLPIIAITQFMHYGIMFHYCVTKEQIHNSDFHYYPAESRQQAYVMGNKAADHSNGQINYLYEQEVLEIVETGNIDYLKSDSTFFSGNIGKISLSNPLRQAQNLCIIHTTLCTRAAIRGGLSPEFAYALSDNYIQNAENCKIPTEVFQVMKSMFADFVERVHNNKIENGDSPLIKKCRDYIQLHIEDGFTLNSLADYTGYTQNYLGTKFKSEMGISLKEYINQVKIERAKLLLISTNQSIFEISEYLGFCSASYFTKIFREQTAVTPAEYRLYNTKPKKN